MLVAAKQVYVLLKMYALIFNACFDIVTSKLGCVATFIKSRQRFMCADLIMTAHFFIVRIYYIYKLMEEYYYGNFQT